MPFTSLLAASPTTDRADRDIPVLSGFLEFFGDYGWRIGLILLLAWLTNVLVRRFIKHVVRGLQGERVRQGFLSLRKRTPNIFLETDESISLRRAQRATTIGVLMRSTAGAIIFIVAFLAILNVFDFDLGPLVAWTTVVTAVLGFGAQNIVRDFLSGFFIVVEDQYGVGDYIDVGSVGGTVESVSLRITRLRNADGTLWQIPNGEIKLVGNKSQKWSRSLVEFRVNLNSDVHEVETIATQVAQDIRNDSKYALSIVDEPEIWGPDAVDGEGVLFKIAIKTRPLEQWRISRVVRTRIKQAFDEHGIRIASAMPEIYSAFPAVRHIADNELDVENDTASEEITPPPNHTAAHARSTDRNDAKPDTATENTGKIEKRTLDGKPRE